MEAYKCTKCSKRKFREIVGKGLDHYIYKDPFGKITNGLTCYDCVRAYARGYGEKHAQSCMRYEKTTKGYLMRTYRNMKSRVTGIQAHKNHLYLGLDLMSKEEFYEWALSSSDYHQLLKQYRESGWDRKLGPSIDRIDTAKGYILGNVRWISHQENSIRGNISKNSHLHHNNSRA